MDTTTINIKVDRKIKREAQRIAEELGLSLSAVIKGYLRQFTRTKEFKLSLREEVPSDWLKKALKESDEDIKAGRVITFENPSDALQHADQLILTDEKKDHKD